MAQPIPLQLVEADPKHEIQCRLDAAPLEHADAILAAYALLQDLQDHGVLDVLRGVTGAGSDVVSRLSEAADTPQAIAGLRNIVSLLRILGSMDPSVLHDIADMVTKPEKPGRHNFGLWKTAQRLASKDTLRGIGAVAYGLQVFGRVLISRQGMTRS